MWSHQANYSGPCVVKMRWNMLFLRQKKQLHTRYFTPTSINFTNVKKLVNGMISRTYILWHRVLLTKIIKLTSVLLLIWHCPVQLILRIQCKILKRLWDGSLWCRRFSALNVTWKRKKQQCFPMSRFNIPMRWKGQMRKYFVIPLNSTSVRLPEMYHI